jgi:hypothetical protein
LKPDYSDRPISPKTLVAVAGPVGFSLGNGFQHYRTRAYSAAAQKLSPLGSSALDREGDHPDGVS